MRSVFAQSLLPCEIIVVDDRSPDQTCAVVEHLIPHSPVPLRLICLEQNSGGPVVPMNTGIAAAQGSIIAMIDHDDLMVPDKLASCLPLLLSQENIGLVFAQQANIDQQGQLLAPLTRTYAHLPTTAQTFTAAQARLDLLQIGYRYGGAGGTMLRKAVWQAGQGFRPQYRVRWDYEFACRMTLSGWDVAYLPQVVFQHRLHGNNLEQSEGGWRAVAESIEIFDSLEREFQLTPTEHAALVKRRALHCQMGANQQKDRRHYRQTWALYQRAWQVPETRGWATLAMAKLPLVMVRDLFVRQK